MIYNDKIRKNTKTILFISLIVAMILPFSAMDIVHATSTNADKRAYQASEVDRLGKQFEKKYLKYIDQEDGSVSKDATKRQMDALVEKLEVHGVTYTEKWEQDKVKWTKISSKYVGDEDVVSSLTNSFIPLAFATANPYFYTGYAHDCWWILTCHKWATGGIQLGEDQSGTVSKQLESSYARSEGEYKVTGSSLSVNFNFVSKLKDGSIVKEDVSGSDSALFANGATVRVNTIGSEYGNPSSGWIYEIQYAVTNII